MRSLRYKAFTLIELLVVIAIIALLAAILFPAFARARENARRAVCQSNMKQIGMGIMQYTQDYDDFMPGRYFGGTATLQNVLQPYIKSYQVFQCPSNTQNIKLMNDDTLRLSHVSYAPNTRQVMGGGGGGPVAVSPTRPKQMGSSFDNGGIFSNNDPDSDETGPVSTAAIPVPSSTIAMCEVNGPASDFSITSAHFATMSNCAASEGDQNTPCLSSHHLGFANYLFADGHVKSLRPERTMNPVNLWNRNENASFGDNAYNAELILKQSAAYSRK